MYIETQLINILKYMALTVNLVPTEIARAFAITNLDFLISTANNFQERYPQFVSLSDKISNIKYTLTSSTILAHQQIEEIAKFNLKFADKEFNDKHFIGRNFSNKLTQLHTLLQRLIETRREKVVNILIASVDKKDPPLGEDKTLFVIKQAEKFIAMTKEVNKTSELILHSIIEKQKNQRGFDVLTVASLLLILVGQRQSHVYYVFENLKKVQQITNTNYDIDEICSVDGKVTQNTKNVPDIVAIRNCISHFAFGIENDKGELFIDFHSNLIGFSIDKRYSDKQLLIYYQNYERLVGIFELFIRSAFLQAILLEHFEK
jgi:hypothetical protein